MDIRLRPPIQLASADPALFNVPAWDVPVLGIDASLTSTGIAVVHRARLRAWTISPQRLMGPARLSWFHDEFRDLLARYRPGAIVIEGYGYGAKSHAHSLGELGGVLRLVLHRAASSVLVVPPNSLKLFVTGNGNAEKETLSKEAFKRWGVDLMQNDAVDAAGLAVMGLAWLGAPLMIPKGHLAALAKCEAFGPSPARPDGAEAPALAETKRGKTAKATKAKAPGRATVAKRIDETSARM